MELEILAQKMPKCASNRLRKQKSAEDAQALISSLII